MPTTPEALANQLVTAAEQAHEDANAAWKTGSPTRTIRTTRAKFMAAAMLRVLVANPDGYLHHKEDGGITYTRTLRALTHLIEKES